jgi:hypothetical protein
VFATAISGETMGYIVAAHDAVGGVSIDCIPASGSQFDLGPATVSCEAIDGAGNHSTGFSEVIVSVNVASIDVLEGTIVNLDLPISSENILSNPLKQAQRAFEAGNPEGFSDTMVFLLNRVAFVARKNGDLAEVEVEQIISFAEYVIEWGC